MTSITEIDALLPQTQCGECGYPGCRPYAEAIYKNQVPIDKCAPGGVATLTALAELLAHDPTPFIDPVKRNYRPPLLAKIREDECIGCTKCIQACPVDAIIGGPKLMHTVIEQECTGCDLCAPACPVDCIDMQSMDNLSYDPEKARQRYQAKQTRQQQQQTQRAQHDNAAKQQTNIQATLARIKNKHHDTKKTHPNLSAVSETKP